MVTPEATSLNGEAQLTAKEVDINRSAQALCPSNPLLLSISRHEEDPADYDNIPPKNSGHASRTKQTLHLLSVRDTPGINSASDSSWEKAINEIEGLIEQPMEKLFQDQRQIQRKLTRSLGNDTLIHLGMSNSPGQSRQCKLLIELVSPVVSVLYLIDPNSIIRRPVSSGNALHHMTLPEHGLEARDQTSRHDLGDSGSRGWESGLRPQDLLAVSTSKYVELRAS